MAADAVPGYGALGWFGFVAPAGSPEYFGEVMRNDYARFGKLVRDIGFQPQ